MNLRDKARELVEREERELDKYFRQLREAIERDDEELTHLDQLLHRAEKAEREMDEPITNYIQEAIMDVLTISPRELNDLRAKGQTIELIDVRTPAEFREVHADFARNVPLHDLDPATILKERAAADEPLYFICRSGSRSKQACVKFRAAGYENVCNVEGGTLAWVEGGLPVVRGVKGISLERQVRMTAGSLVLLGTVLGWLVHPGFLGLAAFVGAGLVFAGATETCGMAVLLARMPWNRIRTVAPACPDERNAKELVS